MFGFGFGGQGYGAMTGASMPSGFASPQGASTGWDSLPLSAAPWNIQNYMPQGVSTPWQTQAMPQIPYQAPPTQGFGFGNPAGMYLSQGTSQTLQGFQPMQPGGGFYPQQAPQQQQAPAKATPDLWQVNNTGPLYQSRRQAQEAGRNDYWSQYNADKDYSVNIGGRGILPQPVATRVGETSPAIAFYRQLGYNIA
jgi:hypothetical protein